MVSSVLSASDFSGVAVETAFSNWGFPVFIGTLIFMIFSVAIFSIVNFAMVKLGKDDTKEWIGFVPVGIFLLIGIPSVVISGNINQGFYDGNMESIKEHYSIDYLKLTEYQKESSLGGVFADDEKSFHPVEIEYDLTQAEGYLTDAGDGNWAVVVDSDAETTGDFIEFDEFVK